MNLRLKALLWKFSTKKKVITGHFVLPCSPGGFDIGHPNFVMLTKKYLSCSFMHSTFSIGEIFRMEDVRLCSIQNNFQILSPSLLL